MNRCEIYKKLVERFGANGQEDIAIEEMAELTKALIKMRRAVKGESSLSSLEARENVIEEIADVTIMLEQLMEIYGCNAEVHQQMERKMGAISRLFKEPTDLNSNDAK
jgi:alcohol dehydrogenase class IV